VTASTYLLSDPWVAENRLDTVDLSELDDTEAFISYRKPQFRMDAATVLLYQTAAAVLR
jgi:hypothetical protein